MHRVIHTRAKHHTIVIIVVVVDAVFGKRPLPCAAADAHRHIRSMDLRRHWDPLFFAGDVRVRIDGSNDIVHMVCRLLVGGQGRAGGAGVLPRLLL